MILFIFLISQIVKILIMEIKVGLGQYLEERLSVKIDLFKLLVCLVIDVAVGETELGGWVTP